MSDDHQSPFKRAQDDLGRIEFFRNAGIDPALYIAVRMSESEGSELPQLAEHHLFMQALLNMVRAKHYQPPPIDPEKDILFGDLVE